MTLKPSPTVWPNRARNPMHSLLNITHQKIATLLFALASCLISACATAPTSVESARRSQIRSVTVVGYDDFDPVSVMPAEEAASIKALTGAAAGYAGGVMGALVVQGVSDAIRHQRTQEFARQLGEPLPDARALFSKVLTDELGKKGVALQLLVNRGYQGVEDRYLLNEGEARGDVVIEVRFSAHIGHSGKATFPIARAAYRVLEASSGKVLARGILSLADRPNESKMAPIEVVMRPDHHRVVGDMDVAYANAEKLRDALNESVQLMARALVDRVVP